MRRVPGVITLPHNLIHKEFTMSVPHVWKTLSLAAITGLAGVSSLALAQYTPPQLPPQRPPQAPVPQQYPPQQYPPQQYPANPAGQAPQQYQQPQQLDPQARQELELELKKAQIQTTLADRVAAMKEDYLRRLEERHADDSQVLDAQADAAAARAGAESAKANTQILTIQLQSGQVIQPPAPGQQMPPNAPILQILQMEIRKTQVQSTLQRQMASIRQKQVERLQAQGANVPPDALLNAQLDLETARAMTEVAALDEQQAQARYHNAGGR